MVSFSSISPNARLTSAREQLSVNVMRKEITVVICNAALCVNNMGTLLLAVAYKISALFVEGIFGIRQLPVAVIVKSLRTCSTGTGA